MSDKSTDAQKAILDAFWRLYRQKPLDQIMVTEVTRAARVHRSTFYRHFSHLEDALRCIEENTVEEIATSLEDVLGAEEDIEAVRLSEAFECIVQRFAEKVFYLRLRGQLSFEELLSERTAPAFRQLLRPNLSDSVCDYLCSLFLSMLLTSMSYAYELSVSDEELVAHQTTLGVFLGTVLPTLKNQAEVEKGEES
ncbi:MAG: TetR/AcrR family transcriptional regulator [Coriobacteriales bacterium]|nr:TetR/AcrR family transcriptional regulator [Coriobacteriales bacterium]